jgi:hypothetical protein
MGLFDKFKGWLGFSEAEKIQLDRRAFLKGMAVTSAGILVPGAVVFDMAREAPLETAKILMESDYSGFEMGIKMYLNGIEMAEGPDYTVEHEGSSFQIHPRSGLLLPDDRVTVDYTARTKDDDTKIRIQDEQLNGAANLSSKVYISEFLGFFPG